jgi:hypothetical protein
MLVCPKLVVIMELKWEPLQRSRYSWLQAGRPRGRSSILNRLKNLELEFFLRPTDSRPFRLGIGPPFGAHDQIYISLLFWTDNYFLIFLWHPLWRENGSVVYSAYTHWSNFHFPISSRPALGFVQPPIQWAPEGSFPGGKATRAWSWPLTSR